EGESGEDLVTLRGHAGDVRTAEFSRDGRVVIASADKTARIWDSGGEIALKGHDRSVASATFSGDGKRVVTASNDKTARIWDTESGERHMRVIRRRENTVSRVFVRG